MMKWLSGVVVMLTGLCVESFTWENKCRSEELNLHHLATKTPYRFVKHDNTNFHYPGCKPLRAWMILRHGTRYPSSQVIQKMVRTLPLIRDTILTAYKTGKGSLCGEEIAALQHWKCNIEDADEKRLAHEGEDEMVELAERFQTRFPEIFPEDYSNDTFKFQFTATQRASESAKYFTVGLFGKRVSQYIWFPEALHKDPILRFYKTCSRWTIEVDKNPDTMKEKYKFAQGPEMKETLEKVRTRLGLNASLTFDDVYLLYMTCSFETAWYKRRHSPWCTVFSERNLQVFEYLKDLEYYWIDGYGFNITYRQACPAVRDMMTYLLTGKTPGKKHSPRAVVYFSHSGSLLKILAHLGLYRDEHALRHDNFHTLGKKRKWRVSYIDAFGTNLAFILFRCGKESKVLTLHQERAVTLLGCSPHSDLCSLTSLFKTYHDSVHSCDLDDMCHVRGDGR